MTEEATIEGKIRYSKDALISIRDLANENPFGKTSIMNIIGDLKLGGNDEYLHVTYTGRKDIARRLEIYMGMVNYDGSHEAMMAALEFKKNKRGEN